MKNIIETIKQRGKTFWSQKRNQYIVYGLLCLLCICIFFIIRGASIKESDFLTEKVVQTDYKLTVLPTGKVTSQTDLNLSFKASDTISSIRVKVGDQVKKGQILATLNNGDELGSLTQAQGGYRSAQAAYDRVLEGATNEEVALAQVNYDNALRDLENTKRQQSILVSSAKRTMLSSGLVASSTTVTSGASSSSGPVISGTYRGEEDIYTINVYSTGNGLTFSANAANDSGTGVVNTSAPTALGTKGLYIQFPSNFNDSGLAWKVSIPNTQSALYVANSNAYQNALESEKNTVASAESLVATRLAELNLKKSSARPADLDLRQADIVSAQGRLQTAQALYENTILRAPADGTITKVDAKVGELAQPQKEIMVLQDVTHLYLEAKVNETSISKLVLGQQVDFTLDAFGKDKIFKGTIIHIDPSATVTDGIVNYKINVSITDQTDVSIKPGMNADMVIYIREIPTSIAIPKAAITTKDSVSTVRTLVSIKNKLKIQEQTISLGEEVDGNKVIIKSGLKEGDTVIVADKKS